jgi:hypothetical protein
MRTQRKLALVAALALVALSPAPLRSEAPHSASPRIDPAAPRGHYIEARTAAVFAGACHYGAQLTTQGREAVIAWCFDGGQADGLSLAGVNVVCAVSGEANLAEDAERHSIVYVSESATPAQGRAAVKLVRARHADLLGDVRSVRTAKIAHRSDEDGYAVTIPGVLTVAGDVVPDRCCKMELQVWYAPLAERDGVVPSGLELDGRNVRDVEIGNNATFRYDERSLGPVWRRHDENNGFVGRFSFGATRSKP